jgi:hypothetical protein
MNRSKYALSVAFIALILSSGFSLKAQQRVDLTGKGYSDAVPWEFKISTGRNSGYWTSIPVPSNWEMHGFGYYTYGKDRDDYKTNPETGWYKRKFAIQKKEGARYRLVFQGSMTDTKVSINGKTAGEVHRGGFNEFSYEITNLITNGENLIEVEVRKPSGSESVEASERNSDYWLFGGIYRSVYIDVLPAEFIDRVAIDARMTGDFKMDVYLSDLTSANQVVAQITDNNGRMIGSEMKAEIATGDKVSVSGKFSGIQLWSHEYPNLYRVKVSLRKGKNEIHQVTQKFGFRTFEVRDGDGFYLNRKRILLKGASMHSFNPTIGRALDAAKMEANVALMKSLNFNTARACHYAPDSYFLDLCDSLGLLVLDELSGWTKPLDLIDGPRLVKELVVRDVNHPCVIMWANGNHNSYNKDLEEYFLKYDIQQRRPFKNAAKAEKWPGEISDRFDLIDTRFYPSYNELTERCAGKSIVCPMESIHALYDGGGGAALDDYWKVLTESKVGGGLIIWALYDEGLIRTDENFRTDNNGNFAADGLVGPNGEKKGSFNAVREIWSPIQIQLEKINHQFNGEMAFQNRFTFVNANECAFEWKLLNFPKVEEANSEPRILAGGKLKGPNVPAGNSGKIQINLPENWKEHDALEVSVLDHTGNKVDTRRWIIKPKTFYAESMLKGHSEIVVRDSLNPMLFHAGQVSFLFNRQTGMISKVIVNSKEIPFDLDFKVFAKNSKDQIINPEPGILSNLKVNKSDHSFSFEAADVNGFDWIKWTILPGGFLQFDYQFSLPDESYYYAGAGFEIPGETIIGKRWMGDGPYRVYQNRLQGVEPGVWNIDKKENVPGSVYNFPEFEGYFSNWYWIQFRLQNGLMLGLSTADEQLNLGVLKPNSGPDPRNAQIFYPEKEGIYFFNEIAPIGEKWKRPEEMGPSGFPAKLGGPLTGSINFRFVWKEDNNKARKFGIEIE